MSMPTMNFPIEIERQQIGRWSCPELRAKDKRLPTIYEKLWDCYHHCLIHHYESITYHPNPYPALEKFYHEFTLEEHKTALSIFKFQVQAYRKILFPDEHKLIFSFCPVCDTKRFFYRLPNRKNKYDSQQKYFPVDLMKLSNLFHCMKCHYVAWDYELSKIEYKEPQGIEKLIQKKEALRNWFGKMAEIQAITFKIEYYFYFEQKSKKLSLDEFFIKKNDTWICIICSKVFDKRYLAQYHLNRIWEDKWLPCYKSKQKQMGICQ